MARYTKQTVTSVAGMNAELTKIQSAIQDSLSRKGDTPNQMEATLDMNSNRIINLPEPVNLSEAVRLQDLKELMDGLTDLCCIQVSGDLGAIVETPGIFVDYGSIDNPATCFQDLGFLPSVLNMNTEVYSVLFSELLPSGVLTLPFTYPVGTESLDVFVNGSLVTDYIESSSTTITFTADAIASYDPTSEIKVKYRYVQLN